MARAGLGLGAQELANIAGVSYPTLNRFEKGIEVSDDTRAKIEKALNDAGAKFTAQAGRVSASVPS